MSSYRHPGYETVIFLWLRCGSLNKAHNENEGYDMDGWRREYGSEKRNALDHELKALLDEFLRRKEADDKEGALLKVRHILEKLVENIFVLEG